MHQMDAVGKALAVEVGQDGVTRLKARIVDPLSIRKIKDGIFCGFSIGGAVLQREAEDPRVITKLRLDEISICDRPSNPRARIELYKASWFKAQVEPEPRWDCGIAGHDHVDKVDMALCRVEQEFGVKKTRELRRALNKQAGDSAKWAAELLSRPIVTDPGAGSERFYDALLCRAPAIGGRAV
jgi:hypothetical protein